MNDGVRVKDVTPGGPAATSGIQQNDRIVTMDGAAVKSVSDVRFALVDKKAGTHVELRVQRANADGTEELTFDIPLQ